MIDPKQLRIAACDAGAKGQVHWQEYMADAADDIERLQAELLAVAKDRDIYYQMCVEKVAIKAISDSSPKATTPEDQET